jgi:hypothetical protein
LRIALYSFSSLSKMIKDILTYFTFLIVFYNKVEIM